MTARKNPPQNTSQDQSPSVPRTRTQSRDQGPDLRAQLRQMVERPGQAPSAAPQGAQPAEQPVEAWQDFLEALDPFFQEVGDAVRVLDRAGWVKVENPQTGHKLYFNKGVTGVTRVESSLPPDAVKGATPPDFYNGRITSIIPPTVQAVGEAIRAIAQTQERLTPPRRRTRDIQS